MTQGRFIVLDGVDCSGKTYLIQTLRQHLVDQGETVKVVKTIGEGPHGMRLREFLLNIPQDVPRINPFSEALIFLAAIKDCYESHTKDVVAAGGFVIMDRYIYSTFVYQSLTTMLNWQQTRDEAPVHAFGYIEALMEVMPVPDLSILVTVDEATMKENMAQRGIENHLDNFCGQNAAAFIQGYAELAKNPTFAEHRFLELPNNRPYTGEKPDFSLVDHYLNLGRAPANVDI